jgi:3-oxoacyl-[acyl-carrier protein] reductase
MEAAARRTVIVTGGSRGLGQAIVARFASAGDRVMFSYRTREDVARGLVEAITSRGAEAVALRADVRIASDVEDLVASAFGRWGSVDVLVNNAGMTRDGLAVRMGEQDWDEVLETNLKGPFLCIRAAGRIMLQQGSGHIISIASLSGLLGREGQVNYSASKAGLLGLTKTAAGELGPSNIKVNAVLPGYLGTDMGRTAPDRVRERAVSENVLGRTSDPDEVAEFIYRLSLMNNVSGQVFNLDSRIL